MRGFSSIGVYIMGGVLGLIAALITIYVWTPQIEAVDKYALSFRTHCLLNSERFLRAYVEIKGMPGEIYAPSKTDVSNLSADAGTTCTITNNTTADLSNAAAGDYDDNATANLLSEHGVRIGTVTVDGSSGYDAHSLTTGSAITVPKPVSLAYAGITLLILGVMPILNSAGFLAVTGANIFFLVRGVGGIHMTILATIGALILNIVATNFGPTFINGIDGIYSTLDGRLFVTTTFMDVIRIIVEFVPVIYTVGLLSIIAAAGVLTAYQGGYRPGRRSSMAMAMVLPALLLMAALI